LYSEYEKNPNVYDIQIGLTQVRKCVVSDMDNDKIPDIMLFSSGYDGMPFPGDSLGIFYPKEMKYQYFNQDIGYFHGGAAIAHAVVKRAKELHPLITTVDSDASTQAQTANRFLAEVYVGFEVSDEPSCTLSYYEVPTFVSVGGRNLAKRIAGALNDRAPELSIHLQGVRHPILRETRMPAVLCSMGPLDIVGLKTSAISAAVADAIDAWHADPTAEI